MSERPTGTKRLHEESDPDVYENSDDEPVDPRYLFDDQPSAKRGKREKGIGGGLQAYTQYVCAKLEKEQQMSNIDIADLLVREHNTGDSKKNDNIRRRVYDALSVIDAVGLVKKDGKNYKWLGRPSIAHADNTNRMRQNLSMTLTQKKTSLIRLIRRAVGLEYLYSMRRNRPSLTSDMSYGGLMGGRQHADEIGEFSLPLLILSTDPSSRMVMETDANNSEVYFKINKNYQLKSSDSVLTELGYDDISRLDRNVANNLVHTLIRSRIPKEIIEEALSYSISDEVYNNVIQASLAEARTPHPLEASGMNAIMKAAKQLDSGRRMASVETPMAVSTLPLPIPLSTRSASSNEITAAGTTTATPTPAAAATATAAATSVPVVSSVAVSNRSRVSTATPAVPIATTTTTTTTTIPVREVEEGERASTPELSITTTE